MIRHDVTRALTALGPFFAVETYGPQQHFAPPWRPMRELTSGGTILDGRVSAVRHALADSGGMPPDGVEHRVAASVAHLGLVARLIAVAIGLRALRLPRVSFEVSEMWWQDTLGGPYPLSLAVTDAPGSGRVWPVVEALTDAVACRYAVSPRVLWGNVGSAANSAARLVAEAEPARGDAARAGADEMLSDRRVDGGMLRAGTGFRRRSCCLIYRVTGDTAAVCGDCVLGGR